MQAGFSHCNYLNPILQRKDSMRFCLLLVAFLIHAISPAQDKYWQQQLVYTLKTELNENEKSLTGFESLVYKNNSPDTLGFIWFHIWPNAYKNDSTALIRQIKNDPDRRK
jgi:hypothetical protein